MAVKELNKGAKIKYCRGLYCGEEQIDTAFILQDNGGESLWISSTKEELKSGRGATISRADIREVAVTIKDLKKGEYFTLKPIAEPKENQVYIRGEYDRSSKKYSCGRFDDISYEKEFSGNKEVYTDFVF